MTKGNVSVAITLLVRLEGWHAQLSAKTKPGRLTSAKQSDMTQLEAEIKTQALEVRQSGPEQKRLGDLLEQMKDRKPRGTQH